MTSLKRGRGEDVTPGRPVSTPNIAPKSRDTVPLDEFVPFDAPKTPAATTPSAAPEPVAAAEAPLPWTFLPGQSNAMGFSSLPQQSPLLRLHQEILQFSAFMTPSAAEERAAAEAKARICGVITRLWPKAVVKVFGSRLNGLVLPTSDWDLVIFNASATRDGSPLRTLGKAIEAAEIASYLEVIEKARVPIVKLRDSATGLNVDICFDVDSGIKTSELVLQYIKEFPSVRPLVLLFKYYLAQRGLNDTYTGGVGSFMTTLMVVHIVQQQVHRWHLANVEAAASDSNKLRNLHSSRTLGTKDLSAATFLNLGTLLLEFLELYGKTLAFDAVGISLRNGGAYFPRHARGWGTDDRDRGGVMLSIENPMEPALDVGKNSYAFQRVHRALGHSHQSLVARIMEFNDIAFRNKQRHRTPATLPSLLTCVLYPDAHLHQRRQDLQSMLEFAAPAAPLSFKDEEDAAETAVHGGAGAESASHATAGGLKSPAVLVAVAGNHSSASAGVVSVAVNVTAQDDPTPLKRTKVSVDGGSASSAAATPAADASQGMAAAKAEVDAMVQSIGLRKPRLIEAILTRKERNVDEMANSITSWL